MKAGPFINEPTFIYFSLEPEFYAKSLIGEYITW